MALPAGTWSPPPCSGREVSPGCFWDTYRMETRQVSPRGNRRIGRGTGHAGKESRTTGEYSEAGKADAAPNLPSLYQETNMTKKESIMAKNKKTAVITLSLTKKEANYLKTLFTDYINEISDVCDDYEAMFSVSDKIEKL